MLKQALILVASSLLSLNVLAGSSASCGSQINCKPGEKSRCEMVNGSSTVFTQVTYLNLTTSTSLFLRDLYAYKIGAVGIVDCYYSQDDQPENWLVFKTSKIHNVIPRDHSEWVKRDDMLHCDPDLNTCLLYVLY